MAAKTAARVLVVRVGAMGDVLHGLPAVTALRTRLPGVSIGWVVDPRWAPMLRGTEPGVVDRVHLAETMLWKRSPFGRATVRSLLHLRGELLAERYDVCVDLQGTMRSAAIGWASGAPRFVGPAAPREAGAAWLYRERVVTRAVSVLRNACELLSVAGGVRLAPAAVAIPRDEHAETWAAEQVGDDGFALFVPTAGWTAKEWPVERFAELAPMLRSRGLRVLVNAADEAQPVPKRLAEAAGCQRIVCSVAQLVALMRRARLVVGGDTGPVHLAAALARPTVALFGPTDPERNGPDFPGARVRVLRHAASVTSYKRSRTTDAGLASIAADEVLHAAAELLGEAELG